MWEFENPIGHCVYFLFSYFLWLAKRVACNFRLVLINYIISRPDDTKDNDVLKVVIDV